MNNLQRNEKEYCQLCGQHLGLHDYIAASATEPEEQLCPVEYPGEYTFDETQTLPRKAGDIWENLDVQF